jgi:hypothetical protein
MSDHDDIRLLTVRQPHAWAIVTGHKDVENRTWPFPHEPGTTIAIHAAKKPDPRGLHVPMDHPDVEDLPRGVVVGFVDVVGCHPAEDCMAVAGGPPAPCSPWALPGHFHWLLASPFILRDPVACRGFLWTHRPHGDVKDQLLAALARR